MDSVIQAMSHQYSAFISYRRPPNDNTLVENFKKILETEGFHATNINKLFYDKKSIKPGQDFQLTIYKSILESYFFVPIFSRHYICRDNPWCAKELYYALQIEKALKKRLGDQFCFIFPFILRGRVNLLPKCIENKNSISLHPYENALCNNILLDKITDLQQEIEDVLSINFLCFEGVDVDLNEIENEIEIPSEEELLEWIASQRRSIYLKAKILQEPKLEIAHV